MNKTLTSLSAAVVVALAGSAHAASSHHTDDLRAQLAKSDLVFVGSVVDVSYASAAAPGAPDGVPHTFVTYDVERVVHGAADAKQITLRFLGGRGKEASFTTVSGVPMFDLKDRDVLMVANNGDSGCPLVNCSDGRYRLIEGMVFSEEGQGIENDGKGGVEKVGFFDLEPVMTHRVSQTTLRLVDHFDAGESRIAFEKNVGRGAHMSETQFIDQLSDNARDVGSATPAIFASADIRTPFTLSFKAEPAPTDRVQAQNISDATATDQERAEAAALRANGGNPVIDANKN